MWRPLWAARLEGSGLGWGLAALWGAGPGAGCCRLGKLLGVVVQGAHGL